MVKGNRPTISLVICNYNRDRLVARAIRSCLSQFANRRHVEVIVIDDCSSDESDLVIQEFINDIVYVKNERNLGIGACSLKALALATGEYFMRVDSDDYISSEILASFAPILDYNASISFVYGDLVKVNEVGGVVGRIHLTERSVVMQHGAGILFRKSVLDSVGGYDASRRNSEDYDLLTRLYANGYEGFYYPVPMYRYYENKGSLSTKMAERRAIEQEIDDEYGF